MCSDRSTGSQAAGTAGAPDWGWRWSARSRAVMVATRAIWAVSEPGRRDLGAAHFFGGLVATGELGLRRAVDPLDLKAGERCGSGLVGDVDEPEERRRGVLGETQDVFVGDQHDLTSHEREGDGQRRVGRPREGRTPVES